MQKNLKQNDLLFILNPSLHLSHFIFSILRFPYRKPSFRTRKTYVSAPRNISFRKGKRKIRLMISSLFLQGFQLILSQSFFKASFYHCRHTSRQRIIGNIFSYYTACRNDAAITNSYSRTYHHTFRPTSSPHLS